MRKEFKIEVVTEGALGTIFLGSSSLPIKKMEALMNQYGQQGWDVSFQLIEHRILLLFWNRESAVITFSRNI
jgi:hypothetical protein